MQNSKEVSALSGNTQTYQNKKTLINASSDSQFKYFPLTWMYHCRTNNLEN